MQQLAALHAQAAAAAAAGAAAPAAQGHAERGGGSGGGGGGGGGAPDDGELGAALAGLLGGAADEGDGGAPGLPGDEGELVALLRGTAGGGGSRSKQQQRQQRLVRPPHLNLQQWQADKAARSRRAAAALAHAVAGAALSPTAAAALDGRALAMIGHSLAKIGLQDPQLLAALVAAATPDVLARLDGQQVTNLIWSVAVAAAALRGRPGGRAGGRGAREQPPREWLAAAAAALQEQLPRCSSSGVAMAVWGLGQLGFSPGTAWWDALWAGTQARLGEFSGNELALLIYACGKLKQKPPEPWLRSYLGASCEAVAGFSPQQLTMSLWGLAASGSEPYKAWLMAWFLTSRAAMPRATTQDLAMWLYSLALLRITPSPVWCTSFVEASFEPLTAPTTRPSELVNVMWAVSCMTWSPPLLYWRGLLDAARRGFARFNAQDLANCVSAATAVDVSSLERRWVAAFVAASRPKLSSFLPVHLAHTATALARVSRAHDWAYAAVDAGWHDAFVAAAGAQLAAGRFSARNLELIVQRLRQLQFVPPSPALAEFLDAADAALARMARRPLGVEAARGDGDRPRA
ncbi:TBC2 [Scenedesmus sp. PABB004]|nr:TBC2 [Scenedesmus sp. PABB004]